MEKNLIEVRKMEKGDGTPFTKNTCYKLHSKKKHPALIYKVAGILYFDCDEWDEMTQKAKTANIKNAQKLRQLNE